MIHHPGIRLGLAALVVALLIRALISRSIGWALDTLGILLLVPMKVGALLMAQLVLFLPGLIVTYPSTSPRWPC